jgi:hypothetical protein
VENPTSEGATTDKINLTELRSECEATDLGDPATIRKADVLALIDAVEAARAYRARNAPDSPSDGQKITRDRLDQALARFQH